MSSERELDEGIKSIKSAWRREHTARTNLKRMLEQAEAENAKLRDLVADMSKAFLTLDIDHCQSCPRDKDNCRCRMFVAADGECAFVTEMRELGIEVE
jgi:hypothetical protein